MEVSPVSKNLRRGLVCFVVTFLLFSIFIPTGHTQEVPPKDPPSAEQPADAAAPAPVDNRISLSALKKKGGDLGSTFGQKLQSLLGLAFLVGCCILFSNNRKKISWRLVLWGLGLQIVLGAFVMKTSLGNELFSFLNELVTGLLRSTEDGAKFLFGNLASGNNVPVGTPPEGAYPPFAAPLAGTGSWANTGAYFAFGVLPTIIFFSSLMAVLYHIGVMQLVIKAVAWVMQRTMGTSGSESLSAAGNIFVGQTEAPLLVRPFVDGMTQSELMAVMTGGFATVAGGVMAAYVGFLQGVFSDIAGHLISASVMSAPAALVCAKLLVPEPTPEKSETYGELKLELEKIDANMIGAAARGAGDGLKLALNVGAMLLAFIALIAMFNGILNWGTNAVANMYYGQTWSVRVADAKTDLGAQTAASPDLQSRFVALALEAAGLPEGAPVEFNALLKGNATAAGGPIVFGPESLDDEQPILKGIEPAIVSASSYRGSVKEPTNESSWRTASLQAILGAFLAPLAWLMGVPWEDCSKVGQLIGVKTVVNEFVAYIDLSGMLTGENALKNPRSVVIAVYALCGFANFSSIAIQIGGIGGIAPKRRGDLAKLGMKAMLAGTAAALMTATVAGLMI